MEPDSRDLSQYCTAYRVLVQPCNRLYLLVQVFIVLCLPFFTSKRITVYLYESVHKDESESTSDLHMDPPEPDYHISMNSDAGNITWR